MRLPKWVTRWVKDNFDVEALELKCRQQEEEIVRLKRKIAELRFYALPEDEREWVERLYAMMKWPIFWRGRYIFLEEYMKQRDEDEIRKMHERLDREDWILPF